MVFVGKPDGNSALGRHRDKRKVTNKINIKRHKVVECGLD